jgi:hypothetical protein
VHGWCTAGLSLKGLSKGLDQSAYPVSMGLTIDAHRHLEQLMPGKGLGLHGSCSLAHQEIDGRLSQTVEVQHAPGRLQGKACALEIGGNHRGGIVRHKEEGLGGGRLGASIATIGIAWGSTASGLIHLHQERRGDGLQPGMAILGPVRIQAQRSLLDVEMIERELPQFIRP